VPQPALGSKQHGLADNILWASPLKAIYSSVNIFSTLYTGFSSLATGYQDTEKSSVLLTPELVPSLTYAVAEE